MTIASAKVPESGQLIRVEYEPPAPAYFGARTLEDLSWKQLFDGLSCTECGRCNDNCPAAMSESLSTDEHHCRYQTPYGRPVQSEWRCRRSFD